MKFLDLDMTIVYSDGSADFACKACRKPGTAYAYLPYGSYHARLVFRGWLKAEMHRLLTRSSNPAVWLEECAVLYSHVRNRGYPSQQRLPVATEATRRSRGYPQQRLPVPGYRPHVSHNRFEPAQQNAGAKETCGRR